MARKASALFLALVIGPLSFFSHVLAADKNELTVYLWAVDIAGTASVGPAAMPIAVDFDTLIDKTEGAFQGRYERRGERWGGALDITYVKLSDEQMGVDAEVKASVVEGLGAYHVNETFNVIGGVRAVGMDISVQTPAGVTVGGDDTLYDGFIGARMWLPFSDKWSLGLRGDIGTGDSDQVWNALVGLNWRFAPKWSAKLAYRWLDYDIEQAGPANSTITADMRFEGPALGVSYYW